jgi:hypothetical protein
MNAPASARRIRARWLALLLVACTSLWMQSTTVRDTRLANAGGPDAASYVSYAYNLREHGVYSRAQTWNGKAAEATPDSVSTPGYPAFLALFMRGAPDLAFMHRTLLAQAALGTLACVLAFLLAWRVAGPAAATATGLLAALSPHLATISTNLLTEPLFTACLSAWLLALVAALRSRRLPVWAATGWLFGATCLVRPTLQPLLPVAAILLALLPAWRARWREGAIAIACAMTLLLPWFAYRHAHPAQPDLLRATLYHGSFPGFMYDDRPETLGLGYRFDPQAGEAMASDAGLRRVIGARMRAQPARYARWYLLGKPAFFLAWDNRAGGTRDIFIYPVAASPFLDKPVFRAIRAGMHALHWPLMLLGAATAFAALLRPRGFAGLADPTALRALALVALGAIVLHMIGAPYPRYGIPFRPLFYLLAVTGLLQAWNGFAQRHRGVRQPRTL